MHDYQLMWTFWLAAILFMVWAPEAATPKVAGVVVLASLTLATFIISTLGDIWRALVRKLDKR